MPDGTQWEINETWKLAHAYRWDEKHRVSLEAVGDKRDYFEALVARGVLIPLYSGTGEHELAPSDRPNHATLVGYEARDFFLCRDIDTYRTAPNPEAVAGMPLTIAAANGKHIG